MNALRVLYSRLSNRGKNWREQVTTLLARENCLIVLEELKIRNMICKPKLNPIQKNQVLFCLTSMQRKINSTKRSMHHVGVNSRNV